MKSQHCYLNTSPHCVYLHDSSNYSLMSLSYATALPVGSSNSRVSSTFQTMWSDLSSLDGPDFVQRGFEQLCQSDDSGLLIFYGSTSFPKNVSLRIFAFHQGIRFAGLPHCLQRMARFLQCFLRHLGSRWISLKGHQCVANPQRFLWVMAPERQLDCRCLSDLAQSSKLTARKNRQPSPLTVFLLFLASDLQL